MSELLDCVVQQVDWIGNIDIRPAGIFVFFDEGREDIELVTFLRPRGRAPKPFNLREGRSVVVIVPDGDGFPCCVPLVERHTESIDPIVLGMRSNEFDKRDVSIEIESNDHPKIAAGNFEPHTFTVQYLRIRSRAAEIVHRTPIGSPN